MEQLQGLSPEDLPAWNMERITRLVYDMVHLPEESWVQCQSLEGISFDLECLLHETNALRHLNSKELVAEYLRIELLKDQDPYSLLGFDRPGGGIRSLYGRLSQMANLPGLSAPEQDQISQTLGYWEEAALNVICNPETYFTKTATGVKNTNSELFGTMIFSTIYISKSPNAEKGKYKQQIMQAIDYDGIIHGVYTRENYNMYERQKILLILLSKCQGKGQELPQEFWDRTFI